MLLKGCRRQPLILSTDELHRLQSIQSLGGRSYWPSIRAEILLRYAIGEPIKEIARRTSVSRPTVYLCVDKALSGGLEMALQDLRRPGRPALVKPEDRAWVVKLACGKPSDYGYAAHRWTLRQLTEHVKKFACQSGHTSLADAQKFTIRRILQKSFRAPINVAYHDEQSGQKPDSKSPSVFITFKDVGIFRLSQTPKTPERAGSLRFPSRKAEENRGGSITAGLLTGPNNDPFWFKAYERQRLANVSLVAGIDLQDGRVTTVISEKGQGIGLINLIEDMDNNYPSTWRIRILFDSQSGYVSSHCVKNLREYPNRFELAAAEADKIWLGLMDSVFTRTTQSFLRSIRAETKDELLDRLNDYIREINILPPMEMESYRVGGGITPAVLPHHRAYGFVHGNS